MSATAEGTQRAASKLPLSVASAACPKSVHPKCCDPPVGPHGGGQFAVGALAARGVISRAG
eukprot:14964957-Alexandrium_andersonii.AAC.1